MGSFNTSCFVSRQTIASGDACKVLPISQARTFQEVELSFGDKKASLHGIGHSTCYPDCFWEPVSGFFDAVYDDYGRFTLSDTANNRALLGDFIGQALKSVPTVAQGENTSHDIPCNLREFMATTTPQLLEGYSRKAPAPDAKLDTDLLWTQAVQCWDHLWEVAQEERLFWADYSGVLRPASYAVMHGTAFDELVAITNGFKSYSGESYEMREFFQRALGAVKTWLAERETKRLAAETPKPRDVFLDGYFAYDRLRNGLARIGGNVEFRSMGEAAHFEGVYEDFIAGKLSDDQLFETLKPMLTVRYACSALESLNLHFEPMVYAGQDYSNEMGVSYARLVDRVSRKVVRGRAVHSYGEFQSYHVLVSDVEVFKGLSKKAREFDGALNLLGTQSHGELNGRLLANFECTLPFEYVADLLLAYETEESDTRVLRESLRQAPAATN